MQAMVNAAPNVDCPNQLVAIDGPVASGKTAVGRELAKRLEWRLFDTGIMYRAATWLIQQKYRRADLDDTDTVTERISEAEFLLKPHLDPQSVEMDVLVNGENVTPYLRTPEVEFAVGAVAAIEGVRHLMVDIQQALAAPGCMVVVGRDIGTVVLPNAPVKIYLDASAEVRARRRALEGSQGGSEAAVLQATNRRDKLDQKRTASPLTRAADAVLLDTSDFTLEQSISAAERIIRAKLPSLNNAPAPTN